MLAKGEKCHCVATLAMLAVLPKKINFLKKIIAAFLFLDYDFLFLFVELSNINFAAAGAKLILGNTISSEPIQQIFSFSVMIFNFLCEAVRI